MWYLYNDYSPRSFAVGGGGGGGGGVGGGGGGDGGGGGGGNSDGACRLQTVVSSDEVSGGNVASAGDRFSILLSRSFSSFAHFTIYTVYYNTYVGSVGCDGRSVD